MLTPDLQATYDDFVGYTGGTGRLNSDVAEHEKEISRINSDLTELSEDFFLVSKTITINANVETVIDITDVLPSGVNHWMLVHAQVGIYPMPYITFTHASPASLLQVTTIDYTDGSTKIRFQSSTAWNNYKMTLLLKKLP